jgi:hypothetical protein
MKRLGFGDQSTKDEIGDRLLTSVRSGDRTDSGLFRGVYSRQFRAEGIMSDLCS